MYICAWKRVPQRDSHFDMTIESNGLLEASGELIENDGLGFFVFFPVHDVQEN